MPKASPLDIDLNADMQPPPAATAPRSRKEPAAETAAPKREAQINMKWPAEAAKALKRAALEADMTMQDYLLTCFQAYLENSKTS